MVLKSSSSNLCFVVLKVLQYIVFPRSVKWRRLVPPLTQSFANRLAPINVTMWNECFFYASFNVSVAVCAAVDIVQLTANDDDEDNDDEDVDDHYDDDDNDDDEEDEDDDDDSDDDENVVAASGATRVTVLS